MDVYIPTDGDLAAVNADMQSLQLFVAGVENRPVVFACQITSAFASKDMVMSFEFDTVTVGAYTDVVPHMTMLIGTTEGARDLGIARVRKAFTSDTGYVGEISEVRWETGAYVTVIDDFGLWQRHVKIVDVVPYMDGDIAYTDQHEAFGPVPIMGPDCVLDISSYPAEVTFPDADDSYVFGSTIASWLWESNAGTWADETTSNPTLTVSSYPANGLIRVSLTITSAEGAVSVGYRYVHVYDATHQPPALATISGVSCDMSDGGWNFQMTVQVPSDIATVHPFTRVIVFSRTYINMVRQELGPIVGRENIVLMGYVGDETIQWSPDRSKAVMKVYGPHYWLQRMEGFPPGVELSVDGSVEWTSIPALTVGRAAWHLLYWRTTACMVMDVRITDDARYATKFESPSQSLWQQIDTIAFKSIYALPGCNRFGQFFLEIEPQLVPEADRTWNTVMEITKQRRAGSVNMRRRNIPKTSMVDLSGVSVDSTGSGSAHFSLSNGHIFKRFGSPTMQDRLLLESQTQANELAGLYMGWQNNQWEDIPVSFEGNNRFIDCFPRQYCTIVLAAIDTIRGVSFTGRVIPRSITYSWNATTGQFSSDVNFEAETFPEEAVNGDVPPETGIEDWDSSFPPMAGMPAFPTFAVTYLPPSTLNPNHPKKIVIGTSQGVFYTETFAEDNPIWLSMNSGIDVADRSRISKMVVTPSGAIYIFCRPNGYDEGVIYRTSGLGGTWSLYARGDDINGGSLIVAFGYNPLASEQVAFVSIENDDMFVFPTHFHVGGPTSYTNVSPGITVHRGFTGDIVNHSGNWYMSASYGGLFATAHLWKLSNAGAAIDDVGLPLVDTYQRQMAVLPTKVLVWSSLSAYAEVTPALSVTSNTFSPVEVFQGMAFSPTGVFAMGGQSSFGAPPYKTSDGGATWLTAGGVIASGSDVWENCGDDNRWVFGGGMTLKLTLDHGTTIPIDKTGNLNAITALIDITQIRFIE